MRFISMLMQAAVCAFLVGQLVAVRPRQWSILSCLLTFSLTTILGYVVLRDSGIGNAYKVAFVVSYAIFMVHMFVIAWQATAIFPSLLRAWLFAAGFVLGTGFVSIGVWLKGEVGPLILGALFFVGGCATLWGSLAQAGVTRILLSGLGVLWIMSSVWFYALPFWKAAHPQQWKDANEWLPAALGFVIFAAMAFYVQAELSRATTLELDAAAAQEVVAGICERSGHAR